MPSPHSEIRPTRLLSPDWLRMGVNPKAGPTALEFLKRAGTSMVLLKARDTTGPTPGIVISRRQTLSSRTIANSFRCSVTNSWRSFCRTASRGPMIGKLRHTLDKLPDPFLEFDHADGAAPDPQIPQHAPAV